VGAQEVQTLLWDQDFKVVFMWESGLVSILQGN